MAEPIAEAIMVVQLRCKCGQRYTAIVPMECPDCQVKHEGVLDQAEPDFIEDSIGVRWYRRSSQEDPAEPKWQEEHSKGAQVVRDG